MLADFNFFLSMHGVHMLHIKKILVTMVYDI